MSSNDKRSANCPGSKSVSPVDLTRTNGTPLINDILEYTVEIDNKGLLPLGNVVVIDLPPTNLSYQSNSTTLNGTAIPDSVSGTLFPLDTPGYTIPIILRAGVSIFKYRATIVGAGSINNTVSIAGTATSNLVTVDARISGRALWSGTTFTVQGANATQVLQVLGCTTGVCCDCNQDGRVDIIDSWRAARISVGIDACPRPGTPAFDGCNVAGFSTPIVGASIDALDALALAQNVVGAATISCCH